MKYFAPNISSKKHCFFGSDGGVSTGLYTSLNINFSSGDDKENVSQNLERIASHHNLSSSRFALVKQGVSSTAVFVSEPSLKEITADGIVTDCPDIILGISTADCAPVLFYDAIRGIIGAAHAGWRGALRGILENTVKLMIEHGAEAQNISAAVGPCLQQPSFECLDDMRQQFLAENGDNAQWFKAAADGIHHLFNLEGYVVNKLEKLGLGQISASGIDTFKARGEFFSYRRNCKLGLVKSPKDFPAHLSTITL